MASSADHVKSFKYAYLPPLGAGAAAGLLATVMLYPVDTIKTRLQSGQGFRKTGGFRRMYGGLLTVATSSMPTAALFFVSYETTKNLATPHVSPQYAPLVHMFAASIGEVLACVIRVPTEIAKQRKQTGSQMRSSIRILAEAYRAEGFRKGLYRGFLSTVARDLPFSFIELPVWELLKSTVKGDGDITSFQSAVCGSIAGGFAGAVTTPLDLAKTRIMLASQCTVSRKLRIRPILAAIYLQSGIRGLFAGVTPRITAFMLGGFVFFGVYEDIKGIMERYFDT